MQLKHLQTILQPQDYENKVSALAWSPNNLKLAVGTSDRQILIFDEKGERRDKFSTKPADPNYGKKSYVIKGLSFSPDSTKIAVAQSDSIVYVYKIGDSWGEKKIICNKFPQAQPVTCIIWLAAGPIICGLLDGKVRALHTKSNKSQSLYGSESLIVALTSNQRGTGFLSGHADGSIVRFFITDDNSGQSQGRVVTHSSSPYALAWPQGQIVAGGCDKRVVIYDAQGKMLRTFDYSKEDDEHEFTVATSSPSGQSVAIGSFDRIRVYSWSPRDSTWYEGPMKEIRNFYTVTALAWKRDGSRVACGGLCGNVEFFESVLRRTFWKDKFELTYVGPSQVLVKPLTSGGRGVVLRSQLGREIDDVRIMGHDNYLVARTEDTLLLGDLQRNLLSEISWSSSTRKEKFYFDNPTVCLVFNAGELSLIEYGDNTILASVRTEFANPHLISVRLNERNVLNNETNFVDNKKLAYLLDLKTICLMDLITGITINQITHDTKIDWLELNETAHKLLFRDKKQRLLLFNTVTNEKVTIMNNVSYVQWIPGSDVALAQTANNTLAVWYNIDLPDRVTTIPIQGDVIDVTRENGKTLAVTQDNSNSLTFTYELDEGLVEFGTAIHDNDYGRAILFLETLTPDQKSEADGMWYNLATLSMSMNNLQVAERCYAALGDVGKSFFLKEILKIALNQTNLEQNPEVWTRLAILNSDLKTAENIYLEQGDIEAALNMYKKYHKWDEALKLAEQRAYPDYDKLKESYINFLMQSGQEEKAAQIYENEGQIQKALELYLKANRPIRASKIIQQNQNYFQNEELIMKITKQMIKNELYEQTADLYHAIGQDDLAIKFYRKGKIYPKAIDLARLIAPEQILGLEEEWGDYLVVNKQLDGAINHFIEAGKTLKALQTSIEAKQWKKALQIIQVFDDVEPVKKYYKHLADYFISTKEYHTAENLLIKVELYNEAIEMYNKSKQWEKAHALASKYLDANEVAEMYIKQAQELEVEKKFRDAEKLYLSVGEPDLAIAMYKRQEQYDNMVRIVERFHPDLVQTTHIHLGQKLEEQNKFRLAEHHYLAASEWRATVNMYRANNFWEDAHRVAKEHGGEAAANQIAFIWARTLPLESAINLLNKFNILEACIDYACETLQFDFAFNLCKNLSNNKVSDVHYKYAMQLEDDGKYQEAEYEFVAASKPKEAVLMYIHNRDWQNAQRIAESISASSAEDGDIIQQVLVAHASECFTQKDFAQFETLMLRAQKPEIIIQQYKENGMWADALRICREYMPHLLQALQTEYHRTINADLDHSKDANSLFNQASDWLQSGEYKQAIGTLLRITPKITDQSTVNQALMQAADLTNRFLDGPIGLDVVKILAPRLIEIGQNTMAAQLYLSCDLIKEAIDCFIAIEEWSKARKIAKELEPIYESYVEAKYKDRLRKDGNVEQLADIDIIGALDLLAEQGQWARCIEKAKTYNNDQVLHKYVALYATQLLREDYTLEALNLYKTHGTPGLSANFNIYIRIALDIFKMDNLSDAQSYNVLADLRQLLHNVNRSIQQEVAISTDKKMQFHTLFLISHYYAVRCACKQVATLSTMVAKISAALLRYTDIIPADKGYYEAGMDMRALGRETEAFVFLNHYLDICDAIEDQDTGGAQMVDHSDLTTTDFPANIPLPNDMYLKNDLNKHDEAKEWVLAISMDQKVNQTLQTDERGLYESSLQLEQDPCVVTGYPINNARQPVTFQRSELKANRDAWTKLILAAKMAPHSDITNLVSFFEEWLGASSYAM